MTGLLTILGAIVRSTLHSPIDWGIVGFKAVLGLVGIVAFGSLDRLFESRMPALRRGVAFYIAVFTLLPFSSVFLPSAADPTMAYLAGVVGAFIVLAGVLWSSSD
jgi:hypothetical protein